MASILPTTKTALSWTAILSALLLGLWTRSSEKSTSSVKEIFSFGGNEEYVCQEQRHTTEILSVDPLVIYINNFVSKEEAGELVAIGDPNLSASEIQRPGSSTSRTQDRTSQSGPLPPEDPAVACLLSRARSFLGPNLLAPHEDFGVPQMVRYKAGEKFGEHYDWYERPQGVRGRRGLWFNRIGSFFVYLDDDEEREGGETWFPRIDVAGEGDGKWKRHDEGGTMFVPKMGNAVFWVNLHANETGDRRTMHAGLELRGGVKTACNIWPRRLYGEGG